jgi:hypothetical protein
MQFGIAIAVSSRIVRELCKLSHLAIISRPAIYFMASNTQLTR